MSDEAVLRAVEIIGKSFDGRVAALENRVEQVEGSRDTHLSRIFDAIQDLGALKTLPDRIDRLETQLATRDEAFNLRFDGIDGRLELIEAEQAAFKERAAVRKEILTHFSNAGSWVVKNWWQILMSGSVGAMAANQVAQGAEQKDPPAAIIRGTLDE